MAHLTKQTVTQKIPAGAKIRTEKNGTRTATWDGRGKKITAVISPCGERCTRTLDEWYMEYRDKETGKVKRIKLFTSLSASQKRMGELLGEIEEGKSPSIQKLSISDYVDKWQAHLEAKEATPAHTRKAPRRVKELLAGIGASTLRDLDPDKVEKWLLDQRNDPERGRNEGMSMQTSNHYLRHVKAFCNYLVKRKILTANPLDSIAPVPTEGHETFERRALTMKELWKLIKATEKSTKIRGSTSGLDRAMCYMTAAYTGLRVTELSHLTPASFLLDLDKPVVVLYGKHTKNGQDVRQPLPKKIAAKLKKYLKDKPAAPLWDNGCWAHELARASLQRDMKDAGISVVDERGHKVDFHALRTTYITSLAIAGVPMQHAQRLARLSSSQIMMRHYAKIGINELDKQVNRIDYLG